MAELESRDVVNQTLSAGDFSPSDAPATTPDDIKLSGEDAEEGFTGKENGTHIDLQSLKAEESFLEDGTARSDTDTSRAEGSVAGDSKQEDVKPTKKFVASKPVSFAKYSVPKVIAANAGKSVADSKGT